MDSKAKMVTIFFYKKTNHKNVSYNLITLLKIRDETKILGRIMTNLTEVISNLRPDARSGKYTKMVGWEL